MNDSPPDPGIALALSSAFLGVYAHGGFLCGMNQKGIFPGHIAGSSAGALAGGFYAAGLRGAELEKAVLSSALKQSFADLGMLLRWTPMLLGRLGGVMAGKRVVAHLRQALPVSRIEDITDIKLSIAVTDLARREARFLAEGPLAESMMASCAVPLLFSGQLLEGTQLHDGGVLHELPIEPFIADPAVHTIIVHSIRHQQGPRRKTQGIRSAFNSGLRMLNNALFELRRKEAERNGKRVIVMETQYLHPGLLQSLATKKHCFDHGHHTGTSLDLTLPS